jgi:hypothetical protein
MTTLTKTVATNDLQARPSHGDVTVAVITPGASIRDGRDRAKAGCAAVTLCGAAVALDTATGEAFVADCARNTEGLLSDSEIKTKYGLSNQDWEQLAGNTPLLDAVRTARERRITNGDAAREAAQRHFANAPTVLGDILTDKLVSPRHRIEAAKELRQMAGNPATASGPTEQFVIKINLGGDEKLVYETKIAAHGSSLPDAGEQS